MLTADAEFGPGKLIVIKASVLDLVGPIELVAQ